jgi:hypothetical protein
MKRTKRLMATMILAAVATFGTPQAFAGIMIGDKQMASTESSVSAERNGVGLTDRNGVGLTDRNGVGLTDNSIVGVGLTDFVGILISDLARMLGA